MDLRWRRRPWGRVLLCALLGAALGLLVYQGTLLTGRSLFALCGGGAGLLAGVVIYGNSQSVRLTDLTMSVPQFSQLHFAVTRESQLIAWKLFVELITRISTQPLHGTGRLRSALTSLYGLLAFTRELLKENRPSPQTGTEPTVEQLAIAMVNSELRPFLTYWHRTLTQWQDTHLEEGEEEWPLNDQCRAELSVLQERLREYVLSFGRLAGVPNVRQIVADAMDTTSAAAD